MSICWDSRLDY